MFRTLTRLTEYHAENQHVPGIAIIRWCYIQTARAHACMHAQISMLAKLASVQEVVFRSLSSPSLSLMFILRVKHTYIPSSRRPAHTPVFFNNNNSSANNVQHTHTVVASSTTQTHRIPNASPSLAAHHGEQAHVTPPTPNTTCCYPTNEIIVQSSAYIHINIFVGRNLKYKQNKIDEYNSSNAFTSQLPSSRGGGETTEGAHTS